MPFPLIHHAAENLNIGDLKSQLAAGADPNEVWRLEATHPGKTPLLMLCGSFYGRSKEDEAVACATALIEAGANVNFRSDVGATPLLLAAAGWPMPRVVAMLIAAGADVTSTGQAALKAAVASYTSDAARNVVRVVSMLIDAGVSVRGKKLDEILPKESRTDDRVLAILLRAGARVPHRMLRYAESRHLQGMPYLWNVSFAGYDTFTGFKFYERRCLESLTKIFAPKFPQLPEEIIPTIVRYAFHPGMYASTGVPSLTPAQVERIRISLGISETIFSLDMPYKSTLDAMFRAGINRELLTKIGSRFEWVPPPPLTYLVRRDMSRLPKHHGRQPFPHELKHALELHLATVLWKSQLRLD